MQHIDWLLFSYRVPAQPSAVRVAVWRDLRQHGALGLGTGLYALPDRDTDLPPVFIPPGELVFRP